MVVYDTLFEDLKGKDGQLLAIISHEVGHAAMNHIFKRVLYFSFEYSI